MVYSDQNHYLIGETLKDRNSPCRLNYLQQIAYIVVICYWWTYMLKPLLLYSWKPVHAVISQSNAVFNYFLQLAKEKLELAKKLETCKHFITRANIWSTQCHASLVHI